MVDVRLSATVLLIFYEGKKRCAHERAGGKHGWHIQLEHFLPTLLRKPGALAGSLALKSAQRGVGDVFERHFRDRPKVFVELLSYQRAQNLSFEAREASPIPPLFFIWSGTLFN